MVKAACNLLLLGSVVLVISTCNERKEPSASADTSNDWTLRGFVKADSVNPILTPGIGKFVDPISQKQVSWEEKDVFNPAMVVRNDTVYMLYRAQDKIGLPGGTSRIGLAKSVDGFHFSRQPQPVLFPDNDAYKKYEWQGGCEDPRIVEDGNGKYFMTYTAFDGTNARLMIAVSEDLMHWKKTGPAFATAYGGKYIDKWSKSGSIVSAYSAGKIVATKIHDKYWMYWGDQSIWAATSTDLENWTPIEMKANEKAPIVLRNQALNMPQLKIAVPTRDKKFDSDLVESGPPAMLTEQGILLIYNSRNIHSIGDNSVAEGMYTAGQVLLDKDDPTKILKRMDTCFMKPDRAYEVNGQVDLVCFPEGLVRYKDQYFLYYGTADSKIAVAVSRASHP